MVRNCGFQHALPQRLFGDPDYLLRVVAADLPGFQQFYDERLATLPGLRRLTSTIVMKDIVDSRPLTGRTPSRSAGSRHRRRGSRPSAS